MVHLLHFYIIFSIEYIQGTTRFGVPSSIGNKYLSDFQDNYMSVYEYRNYQIDDDINKITISPNQNPSGNLF